jgi:hypothetical protein
MENRALRGFGTRNVCMQSMVEIADRHIADEERVESSQMVLTLLSAEDLSVRRASSAERKKALQKMKRGNAELRDEWPLRGARHSEDQCASRPSVLSCLHLRLPDKYRAKVIKPRNQLEGRREA